MRGQISLETIIVLSALAGVFLLLIGGYNDLFDAVMSGIDHKKAQYAADIISDAGEGCSDSVITITLPFDVRLECGGGVRVRVGGAEEAVPGLHCTAGGEGRRITVKGCEVMIT